MTIHYKATLNIGLGTKVLEETAYCTAALLSHKGRIKKVEYFFTKRFMHGVNKEEHEDFSELVIKAFNLEEFVDRERGVITFDGSKWSISPFLFVVQCLRAPTESGEVFKAWVRNCLYFKDEYEDKLSPHLILLLGWLVNRSGWPTNWAAESHSPFTDTDLIGPHSVDKYNKLHNILTRDLSSSCFYVGWRGRYPFSPGESVMGDIEEKRPHVHALSSCGGAMDVKIMDAVQLVSFNRNIPKETFEEEVVEYLQDHQLFRDRYFPARVSG